MNQIRGFHNQVKNDIIQDSYTHIPYGIPPIIPSVLDLACGRGGDIHKFYHANFKTIIAVDNHEESLKECIKRKEECYNNKHLNIQHICHDLKKDVLCLNKKVDVAVMNFALNNFF